MNPLPSPHFRPRAVDRGTALRRCASEIRRAARGPARKDLLALLSPTELDAPSWEGRRQHVARMHEIARERSDAGGWTCGEARRSLVTVFEQARQKRMAAEVMGVKAKRKAAA